MYGTGLVRHTRGPCFPPTLSFMCIWHLEVPTPDLYRFLWCLWTDAILRLRRGTKSGEFRKTGSLPGSDLSYGRNTDTSTKLNHFAVFNSWKRQSWVWVGAWRAIYIRGSTAKACGHSVWHYFAWRTTVFWWIFHACVLVLTEKTNVGQIFKWIFTNEAQANSKRFGF